MEVSGVLRLSKKPRMACGMPLLGKGEKVRRGWNCKKTKRKGGLRERKDRIARPKRTMKKNSICPFMGIQNPKAREKWFEKGSKGADRLGLNSKTAQSELRRGPLWVGSSTSGCVTRRKHMTAGKTVSRGAGAE